MVVVEVVQDPSLVRMSEALAPHAARLRSAALLLLLFSAMFIGTLEGLFGFVAAAGVLCCAPPGPLGTAHAARCTRITATVSAAFALIHAMCLLTFTLAVLPEMPVAMDRACDAKAVGMAPFPADGAAHSGHVTAFLASVGVNTHAPPKTYEMVFPPLDPKPKVGKDGFDDLKQKGEKAAYVTHADAEAVGDDGPMVAHMTHPEALVDKVDDDEVESPVDDAVSTPATLVAHLTAAAARRLQTATPPVEACVRAKELFATTVPTFLYAAILVELALFYAAFATAKAATRLVLAARLLSAQ